MKKIIILSLFFIIQGTVSITASHALDISLGGTVWYAWWLPSWQNNLVGKPDTTPLNERLFVDMPDYSQRADALYGPVLSLNFSRQIVLSSVFVTGQYMAHAEGSYFAPESDYSGINANYLNADRENRKYDSDTTIAWNITSATRIYLGFKFQGYDYRYTARWILKMYTARILAFARGSSEVRQFGPGIGIDWTIHLFGNVFLMAGVSGSFMAGSETMDLDPVLLSTGTMIFSHYKKGIYQTCGANSSVSLAYYFSEINTSVVLGGRYQFLGYLQRKGDRGFTDFDGTYDHFFGITFSVIYTFNI